MGLADVAYHADDQRLQGRPKKLLTPALLDLADRGRTRHPELARILEAKQINQVLGGAFVAPWDVDELPEDVIDTIKALHTELPAIQAGRAEVKNYVDNWIAQHNQVQ